MNWPIGVSAPVRVSSSFCSFVSMVYLKRCIGMRIVFLGTPQFAVPTLEALLSAGHAVCAVFTQPDRPKGRGQELAQSPVKQVRPARFVTILTRRVQRESSGARHSKRRVWTPCTTAPCPSSASNITPKPRPARTMQHTTFKGLLN
jgi:hypothetical protein